jgi:hypothetical protein
MCPDIDSPVSSAGAGTSSAAPGGPALRAWRLLALGAALVLAFAAAVLFLAAPTPSAPFRIHAKSSLLALTTSSDALLSIDSSGWDAAPAAQDNGEPRPWLALRRVDGGDGDARPDRLRLSIRAGEQLTLRHVPGNPTRFSITLPSQASLSIQKAPGIVLEYIAANGSKTPDTTQSPLIRINIGGNAQPALRISRWLEGDSVSERFAVAKISFAQLGRQGVDAALLDGSLQFLDKPETELKLYRGTDLRLGGVDAEIEAIVLTKEGIEFSATGFARKAQMFVSTRHATSAPRSVIPTRYDAMKGDPVIAVAVAAVATLVGIAGLLLTAASAMPRLAHWLSNIWHHPS